MRTRPWPIVILATLHLIAPLPNGMWSAALQHTSLSEYVRQETSRGASWELFSWLAIFPLAAVAIYLMKRWSYVLYIACMGMAIYSNYLAVRNYPAFFSMPLSIACIVFDLGIVSYFLIPAVRAPYFNPRLRWWETKPRYSVALKAQAAGTWGKEQVNLVNISEGGAFVRASTTLQKGDTVDLSFEALEHKIQVLGKIVHMSGGESWGYGIQFDLSPEIKNQIRAVVRSLARAGHKDSRPSTLTITDFSIWAKRLLTSGEGWLPDTGPRTPTAGAAKAETEAERKRSPKKGKRRHLKLVPTPERQSSDSSDSNSGGSGKKAA